MISMGVVMKLNYDTTITFGGLQIMLYMFIMLQLIGETSKEKYNGDF